MTATAQGRAFTCDYAGCRQPGTVEIDAWVYCTDHAGRQHLDAVTHASRPRPVAVPPAALSPVEYPATAGPIGLLLEQASGHSVAKVRRAAEKIETQLAQLRALIAEHAADERRRKAEAASKEKARQDITRLEQQLRAAKAALRGKPAAAANTTAGPKTCTGCGAPIVRTPGQRGVLPSRCGTCKAGAA